MLNFMDRMYLGAKLRLASFMDEFRKDETGVSAIVATVLLILIVVLLASVFWGYISDWFETTWSRITGAADTISTSS